MRSRLSAFLAFFILACMASSCFSYDMRPPMGISGIGYVIGCVFEYPFIGGAEQHTLMGLVWARWENGMDCG